MIKINGRYQMISKKTDFLMERKRKYESKKRTTIFMINTKGRAYKEYPMQPKPAVL